MRTSDFHYFLPPEQIARYPSAKRSDARLLVSTGGEIEHLAFTDLPSLLGDAPVIVVNDTRVMHARVFGTKTDTGGKVELLMVRPDEATWWAMAKASRPLKSGQQITLPGGASAQALKRLDNGLVQLALSGCPHVPQWLEQHGQLPLPPYFKREPEPEDRERYQTRFASRDGAVAAPTAGLHFDDAMIGHLESMGCSFATITLHVGPGTFKPVTSEDPREHELDPEIYEIPSETHALLTRARAEGRPILAVGTTVVRTLEHAARNGFQAGPGTADLLLLPGDSFLMVDALLTNFHLPRSSLLMLVAAFAGQDHALAAYEEAVEAGYRFYSYGDASLWR